MGVAVIGEGGGYFGTVGFFYEGDGDVDGICLDLLDGGGREEGEEEEGQGEEEVFHLRINDELLMMDCGRREEVATLGR